ncbi:MAG: CsxC family protein [Desulfocucumaceae bacterium]
MGSCINSCVNVSGGTQQECFSNPVEIHPVNKKHKVIAKIPVVLAELNVQVDVHSTITLPEEALEIKRIKKRLKLTQCHLVNTFPHRHKEWDWDKEKEKEKEKDHHRKFKLFLEGFVRKNIEFATLNCKNKSGVCGDIRHCTVDVPFSCVAQIGEFNGSPPSPIIFNDTKEFEFFKSASLPSGFPEKDNLLSGDFSEFNQCSFEFFNELPFCELVSSNICEHDEFINPQKVHDAPFEERTFREISEKMVIEITLKVLQKQQVFIPPQFKHEHCCSEMD